MRFLILVLSVTGVLSRPSAVGPFLRFSDDGGSFSYSYQTPGVQYPVHHVPAARFVQQYTQPSSLIVGPAVTYYGGSAFGVPRNVDPANIQVSKDGFVLDTAEVAKARAEHLAFVAQQTARGGSSSEGEYNEGSQNAVDDDTIEVKSVVKSTQQFEPANIQVSADGHVLDTPEVAQAKAEHLAKFAEAAAIAEANPEKPEDINTYSNTAEYKFVQPIQVYSPAPVIAPALRSYEIANIQVANGHVLDTPEVAQAKAEHLARFAQESAKASYSSQFAQNNGAFYRFVQPINAIASVPAVKYFGAADVQISADGHVLDTPEVAQAKSAHFAQYQAEAARAAAAGGDQSDLSNTFSDSAQDDSVSVFAVRTSAFSNDPPADIRVSADGFVLDTPEVAQAKSAHLAKLAIAGESSDEGYSNDGVSVGNDGSYSAPSFVSYTSPTVAYTANPVAYSAHIQKWNGPEADIKVGADGYVIDTPEVQQARAEHLSTRSAALANAQSSSWSGAVARYGAQASADQYIQDTAEVAAARAAHLQAFANIASRTSSGKTHNYGQLVYSAPSTVRAGVPLGYTYSQPGVNLLSYRYAPAAHIALTPDGQFLLDTPEVAAAKAEHFAAHARALH